MTITSSGSFPRDHPHSITQSPSETYCTPLTVPSLNPHPRPGREWGSYPLYTDERIVAWRARAFLKGTQLVSMGARIEPSPWQPLWPGHRTQRRNPLPWQGTPPCCLPRGLRIPGYLLPSTHPTDISCIPACPSSILPMSGSSSSIAQERHPGLVPDTGALMGNASRASVGLSRDAGNVAALRLS